LICDVQEVANANLIAAAPDLLHCVRYALNGIDSDGTDWQDVKRVLLAAELKATGEDRSDLAENYALHLRAEGGAE
jgi:hypothetical protein